MKKIGMPSIRYQGSLVPLQLGRLIQRRASNTVGKQNVSPDAAVRFSIPTIYLGSFCDTAL